MKIDLTAVLLALIAGPIAVIISALVQRRQIKANGEVIANKVAEVATVAKDNAVVAVESNAKAVEAVGQIKDVASVIHTLVNSRLTEEIMAKQKAEALNARLITMLEASGVKLPPDLTPNAGGVEGLGEGK